MKAVHPSPSDDYAPLRDYAVIGDGKTAALIRPDGRVDWLPVPALDGVPVFAALLDEEGGGRIELRPDGDFRSSRRYVDGTNVLQTTFTTDTGSVRVTDALVTGVAGPLPWTEFARRIEGLTGSVRMRWVVRPGTALGTASPWVEYLPTLGVDPERPQEDDAPECAVLHVNSVSIAVTGCNHGPGETERPADGREVGEDGDGMPQGAFETSEGSTHALVIAATHDEPLHVPDPEEAVQRVQRTVDEWRQWSRVFTYDGPWAGAVRRSALALKLLIHSQTGAIAAAATTSLPESRAGGKNWDYRFAWVRDLAYTTHALVRFGLREETQAALSWMLRTVKADGPQLRVFFDLRGQPPGRPVEHDVPGWRGIGPVVSGNPAGAQLQLGVYGDLLDIARLHVDAGNVLDVPTRRLLAATADTTCDLWRSPDSGMWELGELRRHTSSMMGCWQALDAAVHLAEVAGLTGNVDRWRTERDRIHAWVWEHCWSEQKQAWTMFPGGDELDTSVLLHAPSGFDRGERMAKTIDAIVAELGTDGPPYRYSGVETEEFPFVACGFWLASALACTGRTDDARDLMDRMIALSNDVGLFSEMLDPTTGEFWGNLPQGLSHLALINAAITIEELTA
jgi:GH15 family glucan-1,4-alpha-glucosidase